LINTWKHFVFGVGETDLSEVKFLVSAKTNMAKKVFNRHLDANIIDKIDELAIKYNRSKTEIVERMLSLAIELESQGKALL
jgi:hypothetical protein